MSHERDAISNRSQFDSLFVEAKHKKERTYTSLVLYEGNLPGIVGFLS